MHDDRAITTHWSQEIMSARHSTLVAVVVKPSEGLASQSVELMGDDIRKAEVHGDDAITTLLRKERMLIITRFLAIVFLPPNGLARNDALLTRLWRDNGKVVGNNAVTMGHRRIQRVVNHGILVTARL